MEQPPVIRFGCEFELIVKVPAIPHVWNPDEYLETLEKTRKIVEDANFYVKELEASVDTRTEVDKAAYELRIEAQKDAQENLKQVRVQQAGRIATYWCQQWKQFTKAFEVDMNDCITYPEQKNYKSWSVTLDNAITIPPEHQGCWGFEFIGPVIPISSGNSQLQLRALLIIIDFFQFLTGTLKCELKDCVISTSTHVHVSPQSGWTVEGVKRMMCSVYFWDPCIRYLLPAWRRIRSFATDLRTINTNFPYPKQLFRDQKFAQGFYPTTKFDQSQNLCPFLKCTSNDIKGNLEKTMSYNDIYTLQWLFMEGNRNIGWNLCNLKNDIPQDDKGDPRVEKEGEKCTIEFRRPPASMSCVDALCWIDLVVSLTTAALQKGTVEELTKIQSPGMKEFQEWLEPHRVFGNKTIRWALDSKFSRALESQEKLYISLTKEEEDALEKERMIYETMKKAEGNSSSGAGASRADKGLEQKVILDELAISEAAKELVQSRNKEIVFRQMQTDKEIDDRLKGLIIEFEKVREQVSKLSKFV